LAGSLTDRRTRRLTMAVGPVDDSSGEPTAGHGDACGVPVTLGETFGVGPHVGELVRRNPHVLTREPGDGRRGDLHGIEGDTPDRQFLELALAAAGSSGDRSALKAARAKE